MLSGFITTDSVRLSEDGAYRNWRPAARRRLSSVRSLTSWLPTRTTALPCIMAAIQPGNKLRAANVTSAKFSQSQKRPLLTTEIFYT